VTWSPGSPEPFARPVSVSRILGVDPGSLVTGWGLVDASPGRASLLDCGIIRTASRGAADLASRLARLRGELEDLVARLSPSCAAVETPFHGVNPRSALQLAHARGVILAALAAAGLEVAEYTPAAVKKSVTGNGRAPKEQVRRMVRCLLSARSLARVDASDALAVALCHATTARHRAAVARAIARTPGPGE
jgi:crossover junction endodeoxyribonuclease RuvC